MFDIGWSEILVIAVVAIVVVGPKDLPPMLRAFGRTISKMRRMAGEFQGQFNEALREAELDGVKDSINELRSLNPLNDIRKSLDVSAAIAKPAKSPVPPPIDAPPALMTDADMEPAPSGEQLPEALADKVAAAPAQGAAPVAAKPKRASTRKPKVVDGDAPVDAKPVLEVNTDEPGLPLEPPAAQAEAAKPRASRAKKVAVDAAQGATDEVPIKQPRVSRAKKEPVAQAPATVEPAAAEAANQIVAVVPPAEEPNS